MNSFQRKSLYAALAGAGALGAIPAAQAVNVNPGGLGQALIYPYYTVRSDGAGNAFNSLLTVVNSTSSVKAVKVRFLEGKDSREVIDFNLFLSAFDVWTAGVLPTSAGGQLLTNDKSCTLPPIATTQGGTGVVNFVNFAYTGTNDDKGGSSLDRTREGYVEIIEMATYGSFQTIGIAVTHAFGKTAGQPDCKPLSETTAASTGFPPSGGLFGGMTLINVDSGSDYTEDAVALDNFVTLRHLEGVNIYNNAGTIKPDLTNADPVSQVLTSFNGPIGAGVITTNWTGSGNGADAVSAVLMHDSVLNTYVLDSGTNSGTDWVVTFPTKRYYIQIGPGNNVQNSQFKLFQRNFNTTVGSCDDIALNIYDREENTTTTPLTFSPPPPSGINQLCWEANVVTFNAPGSASTIFGSVNETNIDAASLGFQNGWLRIGFNAGIGVAGSTTGAIPIPIASFSPPVHQLRALAGSSIAVSGFGSVTTGLTLTYFGLPVVGFEAESYANGNINGVLSNYGGNFVHKTTTLIDTGNPFPAP